MRRSPRTLAGLLPLPAIVVLAATAHSAAVTGGFVEANGKGPLAAVEVVLRRAVDSTLVAHAATGADGRFRIDSLSTGRYLLRASLLGYLSFTRSDVVLTEGVPVVDLGTQVLKVSPIAIPGVETRTARSTTVVAPDRNIYLTRDMPAATTGTATDILRAVPELDVDMNDHVSLRGSSSVTIQFNGRAAPMKGEDLTTFLRQMPASRIERVEVIANPSAKFDPEGMAGIVNIVLKDDMGLGLSGSVSWTIGQRYDIPGARVAWQKGPLTLFGGLSGSFFHYLYQSSTVRQNLLTTPPSPFLWDVDNRYEGRNGSFDTSVDYALTRRSTLYGTINATPGRNDPHTLTHVALFDAAQAVTSRYDRADDTRSDNRTASVTLGLQHVVEKGKNERSIELLQSGTDGDSRYEGVQHTLVPSGTTDRASLQTGASGYHERAIEADDTHPLGAHGKLEIGYRGSERRTTYSSELRFFEGGGPVVTPLSGTSDYAHREVFHSGYLTVGSTFGRLSLQGGARAEDARTRFDVHTTRQSFDSDYRSLFPSANAAWDFGNGRIARLTYSRRIERPSAYYLNPYVPTTDSLNRFSGNPYLGPKYTNSYSLDASWTGSRGSLRLSPYFRETLDTWDLVTRVDASGVATTTYLNASSVRTLGVSLTASVRQTGRLGGTMSFGVSRENHDASNLSSQYRRDLTAWSANGNITFKTTRTLDLQGYLRYAPARALAQGRASSYVGSTLGARQKLGKTAWISLSVLDPFNLSRYSSSTGDATYTQSSTTHNRLRSVTGSFTWTWGRPPEQKLRRQTTEEPQRDAPN